MNFLTEILTLSTHSPIELIDITSQVRSFFKKSGNKNGLLTITSGHTTAAIKINEKCPDLEKDFKAFLEKLAPAKGQYHHNHSAVDGRDNAHSHLLNYLMNTSETVVCKNGELSLGTWQSIFFIELDGPRPQRNFTLSLIGE